MRKQTSFEKKYKKGNYGLRLYKWLQHKSGRARWGLPPRYPRPTP